MSALTPASTPFWRWFRKTGMAIAARMPMMMMTTRSSMRVKPPSRSSAALRIRASIHYLRIRAARRGPARNDDGFCIGAAERPLDGELVVHSDDSGATAGLAPELLVVDDLDVADSEAEGVLDQWVIAEAEVVAVVEVGADLRPVDLHQVLRIEVVPVLVLWRAGLRRGVPARRVDQATDVDGGPLRRLVLTR